jgi:hypothetical protein
MSFTLSLNLDSKQTYKLMQLWHFLDTNNRWFNTIQFFQKHFLMKNFQKAIVSLVAYILLVVFRLNTIDSCRDASFKTQLFICTVLTTFEVNSSWLNTKLFNKSFLFQGLELPIVFNWILSANSRQCSWLFGRHHDIQQSDTQHNDTWHGNK